MDPVLLPNAGQNPITRHLPKTGQTVLWSAGDDGDHEAGWWRGRTNANNKTRFLTRAISGDDIVIDRATGLMWPKSFTGAGAFGGAVLAFIPAIAWANALNFASFTDWKIPNALELLSIAEFEGVSPFAYPIFDNAPATNIWTSTTSTTLPATAYLVNFNIPTYSLTLKIFTRRVITVREYP